MDSLLKFAKKLIPGASRVGILYCPDEANDLTLVKMLNEASKSNKFEVVAIPIERNIKNTDVVERRNKAMIAELNDKVAKLMETFRENKVDFIYTGSGAAVQLSLATIVDISESMNIPVINFNHDEVVTDQVLASYGLAYKPFGAIAAKMAVEILNGKTPKDIPIVYPNKNDYQAYINQNRAEKIGLEIKENIPNLTIIK